MVSLNPNDISILLLAIELLERQEDQAGFRRALSYSTRILDLVERASPSERSARVSLEQWEQQKKSDLANTHFLRGDLYFKLKDYDAARKDLEISYEIFNSNIVLIQLLHNPIDQIIDTNWFFDKASQSNGWMNLS